MIIQANNPWLIEDIAGELSGKHRLGIAVLLLIALFLFSGTILQIIAPTAGILDIGIISVGAFGLLMGMAAISCSLWLQELLWRSFRGFRTEFNYHFNQLTSWQQCIIYFSVFFLLLYAALYMLKIIL